MRPCSRGDLPVTIAITKKDKPRPRILLPLPVPEEVVDRRDQQSFPKALVQGREGASRQVDSAVFAPLPLLDRKRLLLPVDVAHP